MSLVAFASAKGSPGVTTAALAVGALWPRPVIVADLDPSGGDISLRLPAADGTALDPERGLIALAATARRGLRPEHIPAQVQTALGGLDVIVGVRSAEQGQAISSLWPLLPPALDALPGVDVIADCGRLGIDGAHNAVLRAARYVVLFCRPNLTSVLALRERVPALTKRLRPYDVDGTPVDIVVIGDPGDDKGFSGVRRIFDHLEVPIGVVGRIALDAKGAGLFEGRSLARPARTMLIRSARVVAEMLAAAVEPASMAETSKAAPEVSAKSPAWPRSEAAG